RALIASTVTADDGVTVGAASRGGTHSIADGSTVGAGSAGVGVAIAVNLSDVITEALVRDTTFDAPSVTVTATTAPLAPGSNQYTSQSVSGASAGTGGTF